MDIQAIQSALQDIHYPVSKQELIQECEQKGIAEGKTLLEEHLPEGMFNSAEEVMSKLPLQSIAGGLGNIKF